MCQHLALLGPVTVINGSCVTDVLGGDRKKQTNDLRGMNINIK